MFSFNSAIAFMWSTLNGSKWVSKDPLKKKDPPKKKEPPKDEPPKKKEPQKDIHPRPRLVIPRCNR